MCRRKKKKEKAKGKDRKEKRGTKGWKRADRGKITMMEEKGNGIRQRGKQRKGRVREWKLENGMKRKQKGRERRQNEIEEVVEMVKGGKKIEQGHQNTKKRGKKPTERRRKEKNVGKV